MTYSDLASCDYFGKWQDVLLAVGWLEAGRPFSKGAVSKEFFRALVQLGRDPWQPLVAAGRQTCSLCRFTGGPGELRFEETALALGAANIFVPGKVGVYVAPSLIAHYVDGHDYCPPKEFQDAVVRCPTMKSFAYFRELRARGLPTPAP
jgi:hypothetical protein